MTAAIIGASQNRDKFGNKAVRAFTDQGYQVYPVHPTLAIIEGHRVYASILDIPVERLDVVSFYLPPHLGLRVIEAVAIRPPKEVWFNPGSESPELVTKATHLGLNVIAACSIIAIGKSPRDY